MAPDVQLDKKTVKWYLKPAVILIAIIGIGPFAIPMVWISPAFKSWQKIVLTALTIIFTLWALKSSIELYQILLREMQNLQAALK
ncbi:MAG: hypothetical protein NTY76_03945 [Candidatus Omnitrophica bacterium]|nr:hypothetical protein [Candidatus Omnitrophota bacterium]